MRRNTRRGRSERGLFSLIEMMIATIVLATAATATAYWVETVANLTGDAGEQTNGLAVVKIVEGVILPLPYREPGTTLLGPESGESSVTDFDDIDDFNGFIATPPFDSDGVAQASLQGWEVEISVQEVDPTTLAPSPGSDLKQVRVMVRRGEEPVVDSWWLRARLPSE